MSDLPIRFKVVRKSLPYFAVVFKMQHGTPPCSGCPLIAVSLPTRERIPWRPPSILKFRPSTIDRFVEARTILWRKGQICVHQRASSVRQLIPATAQLLEHTTVVQVVGQQKHVPRHLLVQRDRVTSTSFVFPGNVAHLLSQRDSAFTMHSLS